MFIKILRPFILATVLAVACVGTALAQFNGILPKATAGGGGGCSQATVVLGRVSGENNAAITAFVCGLVTDGIIDPAATMISTGGSHAFCGASSGGFPIDAIFLFAMANSTDALLDICGHPTATNDSASFVANSGIHGTASTTDVVDTNLLLGSLVNFSQNSAHLSVWTLPGFGSGSLPEIGVNGAVTESNIVPQGTCEMNSTTGTGGPRWTASIPGWFLCQRTSSSVSSAYQAGVLLSNSTGSDPSGAPASDNTLLTAGWWTTAPASGSTLLGMVTIGSAFTTGQITAFNTRGCTYLTAVFGSC